MTQELELWEKYTYREISELRQQFETSKEKITEAKINHLITCLKEKLKHRNLSKELYMYCKEHHPNLVRCAKIFKSRTEKKDNQICIEGETGTGKSTLALCLFSILSYIFNRQLNLEKNVVYYPKTAELSERLVKLGEYDLLWVDETIKSLYKGRWMNKDVMESNEIIQTERFRHNTIVYCIPSFNELTKSFRDVNIKFRIWAMSVEPSTAILRVKEKHPDIIQKCGAWHNDERFKRLKKYNITPLSTTEEYLAIETKLAGYVMSFDWPDVEKIPQFAGFYLLYEMMKKRSRILFDNEIELRKEDAMTLHEHKRKETIKGLMRLYMEKNKCAGFQDWYKERKDYVTLTQKTLLIYWNVAERAVRPKNKLGQDTIIYNSILNPTLPVRT